MILIGEEVIDFGDFNDVGIFFVVEGVEIDVISFLIFNELR